MKTTSRLWRWLGLICVLSFGALGYLGWQIYLSAPPIPATVVTTNGEVLFTGEQIQQGQQAWLKAGGQQLGTVWGHGSYVAPDWSADWLHREAVALQNVLATDIYGLPYAELGDAQKAVIDVRVKSVMRANTYDASTGVIALSPERAKAVAATTAHFEQLFGNDPSLVKLREQYAMPDDALPAKEDRAALAAFFFWSSWSAATDRPGEQGLSYT